MNWIDRFRLSGKYVAMGNIIINQAVAKLNRPAVNVLGIMLLVSVILFSFLVPCPSRSQYIFLRIGFSFGISTSFLPIIGKIRWRKQNLKGLFTTGLIFFSYLVNPATLSKKDRCNLNVQAGGKVLIGEKPLEGAQIILPQLDFKTFSNSSGEFLLQWKETLHGSDSILIQIQADESDTSFYWKVQSMPLQVYLADPIIPISKQIIQDLLDERMEQFAQKMRGKYLKWKVDAVVELKDLLLLYEPFEQLDANYRNEFLYEGITQKAKFRVRLDKLGITEVNELPPYEQHDFDSCSIYVLNSTPFPNYKLHYLMKNDKPLKYKEPKPQYIADDYYKLSVSYWENVRCMRVLLDCSKETGGYKIRQMEVYGFLPREEYVLKFTQGKWGLTESKNK